jgi:hypothetical protein
LGRPGAALKPLENGQFVSWIAKFDPPRRGRIAIATLDLAFLVSQRGERVAARRSGSEIARSGARTGIRDAAPCGRAPVRSGSGGCYPDGMVRVRARVKRGRLVEGAPTGAAAKKRDDYARLVARMPRPLTSTQRRALHESDRDER